MIAVAGVERKRPWDLIPSAKLFTPYLYKHVSSWLGQGSRLTSEPMTLQAALGVTDEFSFLKEEI